MRYRFGTYPSATMHSFIVAPLLLLSRCPCTIHARMDNCFLWRWTSTGCTFPEPGPLKTAAESATPPPNLHSDVEPLYRCSAASPVAAPGHSNTAAVTTATPPRTPVHAKSFRRHSTGRSFATTGHITTGPVMSITTTTPPNPNSDSRSRSVGTQQVVPSQRQGISRQQGQVDTTHTRANQTPT